MGLFEKIKNMVTEPDDNYYGEDEMDFEEGFEEEDYFAKSYRQNKWRGSFCIEDERSSFLSYRHPWSA